MLPELDRSISMASGHLCGLAWYVRENETGVIKYGRWKREGQRISTSATPRWEPARLGCHGIGYPTVLNDSLRISLKSRQCLLLHDPARLKINDVSDPTGNSEFP